MPSGSPTRNISFGVPFTSFSMTEVALIGIEPSTAAWASLLTTTMNGPTPPKER